MSLTSFAGTVSAVVVRLTEKSLVINRELSDRNGHLFRVGKCKYSV